MGRNFRETLEEQLKDPAFKAEWDALEPEFAIIQAMIDPSAPASPRATSASWRTATPIRRFARCSGSPPAWG